MLRGRARWRLAALGCLLLGGCGEGDDAGAPIADGRLVAHVAETGTTGFVHDVVAWNSTVVALVSRSDDLRADVVLRSTDAGATWESVDTLLADAVRGAPADDWTVAPYHPRLHRAGPWLVATRTVGGYPDPPSGQAVAVSDDDGRTWSIAEVPAPAGRTPFVHDAVWVDDRLVLVGAVQDDALAGAGPAVERDFGQRRDAYDAAVWAAGDPTQGFEAVRSPAFDDVPDAQVLREAILFEGRLVAVGGDTRIARDPSQCCFLNPPAMSWESADGGRTWSALAGLPTELNPNEGSHQALYLQADRLVLGLFDVRLALEAGRHEWTPMPDPDELYGDATVLDLGDGQLAVTWVEDTACDCAVSYGGSLRGNVLSPTRLEFDACRDESVRGENGVQAPHRAGATIAALAWCNDRNRPAASVAWSDDRGQTWSTERLRDLAPEGATDLLVFLRRSRETAAPVGDGLLALLGAVAEDPSVEGGEEHAAPIVAVRVLPG